MDKFSDVNDIDFIAKSLKTNTVTWNLLSLSSSLKPSVPIKSLLLG